MHRHRLRTLAVSGAFVGLASVPALGQVRFTAPYGPGGTWVVYELVTTPVEWDRARVDAKGMVFNGVSGSLPSIGSAEENQFIRSITVGNYWIGLHDSDGLSTIDGELLPGTERGTARDGWLWVDGEPYNYQNWGGGEPNDWPNHVPPGEDAVHIRGDGMWNDDRAGTTLGQAAGANNPYVVKYKTNSASAPFSTKLPGPAGGAGTWGVREIAQNGGVDNLSQALQSALSTRAGTRQSVDYQAPVLNLWDSDGRGNFGNDTNFRVVTNGLTPDPAANNENDMDQVTVIATGRIRIPRAGVWTFGVNSDDGFRLTVDGQTFTNPVNGDVANGSLAFFTGRGASDTLGQINFAQAGDYDIQLINWEGGGGAAVEVFAAEGAQATFNHNFNLIGRQQTDTVVKKGPKVNSPMNVAVIRNGANNLATAIQQAEAHKANPGSVPNTTTGTTQTIAFNDPQGSNFPGGRQPPVPFPGNDATDENNFAALVTGTMTVDPDDGGVYTFAIFSDDSFRFRVPGTTGWTVAGGSTPAAIADGYQTSGCCSDAFGTVNLPPGTYEFELIMNEIGGGAGVGVWVAPNAQTSFGPSFQLLGENIDVVNFTPAGLELVDVPEPGSMTLLGLGVASLLVRRRRK